MQVRERVVSAAGVLAEDLRDHISVLYSAAGDLI